jgi:sulfide:quinone oxidoreductase
MADIVVMGAGLGGVIMAYEMKDQMRPEDKITVVTKDPIYHFVPSNPWVAVNWRTRESVEVDLAPTFARRGIDFKPVPVEKLDPEANSLTLADGSTLKYDYLIIATGPELAFDEIEGFGPVNGHTQLDLPCRPCGKGGGEFEEFCKNPKPIIVGAVQGASCFGPAYEFTFILDTELRRRKIRDQVPMTFVTAEPYVGHLGLDGVGDTKGLLESEMREHHIKWMTSSRVKKVEAGKMTVEEIADDGSVKADARDALRLLDDAAGVPRHRAVARHRGPRQSARLRHRRQAPAEPEVHQYLLRRRLRRHPADGPDAGRLRRAEDRLHDRVDGHRHGA